MKEVYDFLIKDLGLRAGDTVVVGVSGGPDSMALLHILSTVKKETDIYIVCAHVNHNVRKESDDEKTFLEKYCDNNQIYFESMKIEEYGDDNFHNEARSKRYTFFSSIVKKFGARYLLTAHHADDLIETILMRIARGSSLKGYSGFLKIVDMGDYQIIRPFITITKEEILEYNKQNGIKYVEDASNKKDKYTRNRYRKYVLPFLKSEDPKIHQKFIKFSDTLLECNDYIDRQMIKVINDVYNQNIINIEKFLELDKIIQHRIINYILECVYQDDLMLISDVHFELIYKLIKSSKASASVHLPNDINVVKSYNNLTFVKESVEANDYEIELSDYVNLSNGMNLEMVNSSDSNSNFVCRIYSKEIKLPLYVRNRRLGDKMDVKGMLGSKKVKDIFIDEKIPLEQRETWPIVLDSLDRIVWLPGLKKSKFNKEKDEKYDIIIKYY